jgi:predicted  nucleic acid-binding Zn-ribbon protein
MIVTTEYNDTEARLKVLQKEEEQMLSFMDDKSATIQDLLAIEREIAQVREKRESLQARMNVLMNQTAYSQFNIQLQTSFQEVTTPQGTFSKAKTALIKSINSMLLFV